MASLERAAIDDEYAAAVAEAARNEALWREYESERQAWLEIHAPDAVDRAPVHECSIVLPTDGEEWIQFEEFDAAGTLCGALAPDGTRAFGAADYVIATSSGRPVDDAWVTALVAALARERSWNAGDRRDDLEVTRGEGEMFHLTAAANRESILRHGLDWRQMAASRGVAGARAPELPAIFLCATLEKVTFFERMARWPCDVWAVRVDGLWIENGPSGWAIVPDPIGPDRLRIVEAGIQPSGP